MRIKKIWWWSIPLLIVLVVYALNTYRHNSIRTVYDHTAFTLQSQTREKVAVIQQSISRNIDQIRFLHSTPPISGITRAQSNGGIDNLDKTTLAQWQHRLSTIFKALIENDASIRQLRVISVEDAGQEFLRVDREGGRVTIQPTTRLQNKSEENYYEAASTLQPNQVYVGPINLNKEYGNIAYPLQPTYRLAIPIFYASGARFGFIIMNIDASPLLSALNADNSVLDAFWVVDNEGYIVFSPVDGFSFTRQLAPEITLDSVFSLSSSAHSDIVEMVSKDSAQTHWFGYRSTLLTGTNTQQKLFVYGLIDKSKVLEQVNRRFNEILLLTLGAMSIVFIVLSMFYRSYAASLKLNKANLIFQAIVEGSTDAVICISPSGLVKTWNSTAAHLFNVQANLALNRNIDTLVSLNSLDLMDQIEQCKSSKSTMKFQDIVFFSDNRHLYLDIIISPVMNNHIDEIDSYVISARDVTEMVEAQEKLKQYNTELENEVDKRTLELQQHSKALEEARNKALEASQAKSNFISTISHEMRTPLNGMVGTLSLIRNHSLNTAQKKYLTMAENSVNTLSILINDILDLSKIESGKLEVHNQRFFPRDVIENMVQSTSVKAFKKGLEVVLDTTEIRHKSITCDPNRLKQILNNLMNNAIKFTQSGTIKIIASTERLDDMVRLKIEVADTGIGIAKENQHRLFQPFSQEGADTATKYGGTGLGLSICRQLCELMNGYIDFESKQGVGSQFNFYLDINASECEAMPSECILDGVTVGISLANADLTQAVAKAVENFGGKSKAVDEPLDIWLSDLDTVVTEKDSPLFKTIIEAIESHRITHPELPNVIELSASSVLPPYRVSDQLSTILVAKPLISHDLITALIGELDTSNDTSHDDTQNDFNPTSVDLSGVHVLVVDDNEINQEVAKGFLAPLGANVKTADNGRQALDLIEQAILNNTLFDCILMDCQMPVMDGYECSKTLRFSSQYYDVVNTPIIAMTANAFSGEKEKCFAHGMNDYITKPVNAKLLIDKVARWTRKHPSSNTTQGLNHMPAHPAPSRYSGWNKEAALKRMEGDDELLEHIVSIFQQSSVEYIETLEAVINHQDIDQIAHWAHKLKGLCSQIGADELSELMAELEQEVRYNEAVNFKTINEILQRSLSEFANLKTALNDEYSLEATDDITVSKDTV